MSTSTTSSRTADRPCADCLDPSVAAAGPGWRLSRPVAFWVITYAFAVAMLGTTLPTPLYVIYQAQWHFSTSLITLIFAVYAAGVLAALLFAGRSSDQVGRRSVLATAIALSIASAMTFILAPSVGWLFLGRVLSGLSAGLMTGTATAALTETARPGSGRRASLVSTTANMGGLGLGPLLAGVLAQYAPEPTVLPFVIQLGLVAIAGVALLVVPETVSNRSALTLKFRGLGIPRAGRAEFIAAGFAGFAAFSLLGLFSALTPTFLGSVLHETSHAVAGIVVFLAFGVGAVTQLAGSRLPSRPVIMAGLTVFLAALALIVAGLSAASLAVFLAGTVVSGVAVGAVFMGSLAVANRLAPPESRGQVISTYFVFAYVGLSVPAIAVGFGSQAFGDFRATLVCAIVLAALAVASMAVIRRSTAQQAPRSPHAASPARPRLARQADPGVHGAMIGAGQLVDRGGQHGAARVDQDVVDGQQAAMAGPRCPGRQQAVASLAGGVRVTLLQQQAELRVVQGRVEIPGQDRRRFARRRKQRELGAPAGGRIDLPRGRGRAGVHADEPDGLRRRDVKPGRGPRSGRRGLLLAQRIAGVDAVPARAAGHRIGHLMREQPRDPGRLEPADRVHREFLQEQHVGAGPVGQLDHRVGGGPAHEQVRGQHPQRRAVPGRLGPRQRARRDGRGERARGCRRGDAGTVAAQQQRAGQRTGGGLRGKRQQRNGPPFAAAKTVDAGQARGRPGRDQAGGCPFQFC